MLRRRSRDADGSPPKPHGRVGRLPAGALVVEYFLPVVVCPLRDSSRAVSVPARPGRSIVAMPVMVQWQVEAAAVSNGISYSVGHFAE